MSAATSIPVQPNFSCEGSFNVGTRGLGPFTHNNNLRQLGGFTLFSLRLATPNEYDTSHQWVSITCDPLVLVTVTLPQYIPHLTLIMFSMLPLMLTIRELDTTSPPITYFPGF